MPTSRANASRVASDDACDLGTEPLAREVGLHRRLAVALSLLTIVPVLGALAFPSGSLQLSLFALGLALVSLWLALRR